MKTSKKLLSIILTACMVFALLPAPFRAAAAEVNVCEIEGIQYTSLNTAILAAPGGSVITMLAGYMETAPVTIDGKAITLNLNGKTVDINTAGTATALTVIKGGSLELSGSGELNVSGTPSGVYVSGTDGSGNKSKATVTNASSAGNSGIAVHAGDSGIITVTGNVSATGKGSKGVFTDSASSGQVTVKGDVTVIHSDNGCGVGVSGSLNSVTIEGGIDVSGANCLGATLSSGAGANSLTVEKDINVSGTGSVGTKVDGGTLTVNGSVFANGDNCAGTMAYHGEILVNGSVRADGTGSTGAVLPAGGGFNTITVNGRLIASTFIIANGTPMAVTDGTDGTGSNSEYRIYSGSGDNGPHIVKVKLNVQNVNTGGYYMALTDALISAADGDVIKLLNDVTESVAYTAAADKTVTVDGQGYTVTALSGDSSVAFAVTGEGTLKLEDITLQGSNAGVSVSCGLMAGDALNSGSVINILSIGAVRAFGGKWAGPGQGSAGVANFGAGTVYVTEAAAGNENSDSYGVLNFSSGTVNVVTANAHGIKNSYGVYNYGHGTINVSSATAASIMGTRRGVYNLGGGTVNADTASGTDCGVFNDSSGTVNVTTAAGGFKGVFNGGGSGTVNVGTATGVTPTDNEGGGTINAGADTALLILNKGAGAGCVLDSITVAASGNTQVGTLPGVYENGVHSSTWYTDSAKTALYGGGPVTAGMNLYSIFYKAKISSPAISGITAPVTGAAPTAAIAAASEYTATISWNNSPSTFAAGTIYTATITIMPKDGYTLEGVPSNFFTVAGATAANAADSGVVTAVFPATASSGGGSPTTVIPTATASGSTATINVTPTISGGMVTGLVTAPQVSEALDKAKSAAGTNGTPDLVIQIDGAFNAGSSSMTIPQSSMQMLVSGGVGTLTISGPAGSVGFGAEALKTIAGAADDNVTVTIVKTDNSQLSDVARQTVGSHPVFEFKVTSKDKIISQFSGSVTVSVPYIPTAEELADPAHIVVWYIDAGGNMIQVPSGHYNPAIGTVVFSTTHFSYYAVAYDPVIRLAGTDRIETALNIAQAAYPGKIANAVLATADNYPDALAGSVLAYQFNAPILLVGSSEADQKKVLDYLKANLEANGTVYILGGAGVIGKSIEDELSANGIKKISRLAGADRYETSVKIASQLEVKDGTPVVLVSGENYPDALSVSSIAAQRHLPILLVQKDGISDAVRQQIAAIKTDKVYIIGLQGVISPAMENQVAQITGLATDNIVRIGGDNRYATSLAVAQYFNLDSQTVNIATGNNYPDALAGSIYAAKHKATIILADGNLPDQVKNYLRSKNLTGAAIFGGETIVGKDIEQQVKGLIKQ